MPVNDEPVGERELVAGEALELIREGLDALGLTPEHIFVSFVVEERDDDGSNAVSAGWHEEEISAREVFFFFLSHTISMGAEIGIVVKAIPLPESGIGHD